MSNMVQVARAVYTTGLRDQHAVENQAVSLLERQIGRLENYPEMAERMRQHVQESREQAQRLESILHRLDTSHSSAKDAIMSFAGNMAALMHTPAPDEVIKNTFANFAFEHYEIAAYKSLITLAELAGDSHAISLLQASLSEEEAMARWLDQHIAATSRTFVSRKADGDTAGR